jgi:predicted O-methyltransferase YrrM
MTYIDVCEKIAPLDIKPFFNKFNDYLTNEEFLTEFILKKIGVGFRSGHYDIKKGDYLPDKGFKIKIWPDELARFLLFIHKYKNEINSYLELGTGSGGTFYVIDSYLRHINPNMNKSLTIDVYDTTNTTFKEYKEKNLLAFKSIMKTHEFKIDRYYDLCFIDADHTYEAVKRDYNIVKDYCKFIAFHDIVTTNPKKPNQKVARHLWQELDCKNKIEIISTDPRVKFSSGIGVIWN